MPCKPIYTLFEGYWSILRSHVFYIAGASSLYVMNRDEDPFSSSNGTVVSLTPYNPLATIYKTARSHPPILTLCLSITWFWLDLGQVYKISNLTPDVKISTLSFKYKYIDHFKVNIIWKLKPLFYYWQASFGLWLIVKGIFSQIWS